MSLSEDEGPRRRGAQEPRIRVEPEWAYTDGQDCEVFATAYGMKPDPWQRMLLDGMLARTEDDRYACESVGLSLPRQNGKNAVLEMRELYGLAIVGETILHSAHEVRTTNTAFRRLARFFEDEEEHPEMHALLRRIRYTNGQEAIELKNGGVIRFCARSRNAARGMTFDVVVFDEAQELNDDQVEAMLPTMAASGLGNRQIIYTGTPPAPGSSGTVFRRTRETAINGSDSTLAWYEWSVEEPGDISDRERWYQTNPAMGIRLSEEFTEKEFHTLSPDGFARERLGWWQSHTEQVEHVIDASSWDRCETLEPPTSGVMCAGVKFGPDRATLAACIRVKQAPSYAEQLRTKEGPAYVEWVDTRTLSEGVGWISQWLCSRRNKIASVAIDGTSGTGALTTRLADEGFPRSAVVVARPSDMARAVSMLAADVAEGNVTHYGQQELTASATKTARRAIGRDGVGFEDADGADATLIEACCLALWQARTTKRRPGRRAVVY